MPLLYGLAKTHKEGNKMLRIPSNVNSPFLNLSSWLLNKLRHFAAKEGFDVSNSIDFIQEVKEIVLDDEILMSFDVVSLFPSIPIELTLKYIKKWLTTRNIDAPRHGKKLLQISQPNFQTD
jgi:hypothetical protein